MNLDGISGLVDVDINAGQSTAQQVSHLVDEMQQSIDRIGRAAQQGVASWTGKASNAFDTTHADWNGSAVALNTALNDIRAKLTSGFTGYEDHDGNAAGGFGGAGAGGSLAL
ncbi:MAG: WXG100 family type VII secretion target [Gordonia sp. (in: high G+C Gram-positive bacteria)]